MSLQNHALQVSVVYERDGMEAALAYAKQTLEVYRKAARRKPDGSKTFAHYAPFRPHFVASIIYLRNLLRATKGQP